MKSKKLISLLTVLAVLTSMSSLTVSAQIIGASVNDTTEVTTVTEQHAIDIDYLYNIVKAVLADNRKVDDSTITAIVKAIGASDIELTEESIQKFVLDYINVGIGASNDVTTTTTAVTTPVATTTSVVAEMPTITFPSTDPILFHKGNGTYSGVYKNDDNTTFGNITLTYTGTTIKGTLTVSEYEFSITGVCEDGLNMSVDINGIKYTGYLNVNSVTGDKTIVLTPNENQSMKAVPNSVTISKATKASSVSTTMKDEDAPATSDSSKVGLLGLTGTLAIIVALTSKSRHKE